MELVTVCPWCYRIVENDPLFPTAADAYPGKLRCCGEDCRHRREDGGCPTAAELAAFARSGNARSGLPTATQLYLYRLEQAEGATNVR